MKNIIKNTTLWVILSIISFNAHSGKQLVPLNVALPNINIELHYERPVYLDQVLLDTQKQTKKNITRYNYALYDLKASSMLDALQSDTVVRLESLHGNNELINWIRASKFSTRKTIELDLDKIRREPTLNPLLTGDFSLKALPENKKITILGAVDHVHYIDFQPGKTLDYYLTKVKRQENALQGRVTIIQSDGKPIDAKQALWKGKRHFLTPNAIIYVGFDLDTHELSSLNENMITLLANTMEIK